MKRYEEAKSIYAKYGVDVENALEVGLGLFENREENLASVTHLHNRHA